MILTWIFLYFTQAGVLLRDHWKVLWISRTGPSRRTDAPAGRNCLSRLMIQKYVRAMLLKKKVRRRLCLLGLCPGCVQTHSPVRKVIASSFMFEKSGRMHFNLHVSPPLPYVFLLVKFHIRWEKLPIIDCSLILSKSRTEPNSLLINIVQKTPLTQ